MGSWTRIDPSFPIQVTVPHPGIPDNIINLRQQPLSGHPCKVLATESCPKREQICLPLCKGKGKAKQLIYSWKTAEAINSSGSAKCQLPSQKGCTILPLSSETLLPLARRGKNPCVNLEMIWMGNERIY